MICMPSFIKGAVVGAFVSVIATVAITLTVVGARQPKQAQLRPEMLYLGDDYEAAKAQERAKRERAKRLAEDMRKDSNLPNSTPLQLEP